VEGFVWKFDREYRSLQPLCDLEIGLQETRLGKLYWARLLFVLFFCNAAGRAPMEKRRARAEEMTTHNKRYAACSKLVINRSLLLSLEPQPGMDR